MVAVIVGEGGSGGAVALASGERVLMLEHAVYSVISPEGCASILWRTAEKASDAAEAMKVTAQDLLGLGVIDRIVKNRLAARTAIRPRRWKLWPRQLAKNSMHWASCRWISCEASAKNGSCGSARAEFGPTGLFNRRLRA